MLLENWAASIKLCPPIGTKVPPNIITFEIEINRPDSPNVSNK